MALTQTLHIRIEGRVQGVGYRAWMASVAGRLGVTGWVRNRRDRSVEAVVHGRSDAVRDLISRCRRGPWAAGVTQVLIVAEAGDTFDGFDVRPTV